VWNEHRVRTLLLLFCCATYPYWCHCIGGPSYCCGFVPSTCLSTTVLIVLGHAADARPENLNSTRLEVLGVGRSSLEALPVLTVVCVEY